MWRHSLQQSDPPHGQKCRWDAGRRRCMHNANTAFPLYLSHCALSTTHTHTQALVSECDVFSPNEGEAESLVGHGTFLELTDR